MKQSALLLSFALLMVISELPAQVIGTFKPDGLEFTEETPSFLFTRYGYNQMSLVNGFNSTIVENFRLSTGDDLVRSQLGKDGFTHQNFATFPSSKFNAQLREMTYHTEGSGTVEDWRIGVTPLGVADPNNFGVSAFRIQHELEENATTTVKDVLYIQPRSGFVGFGGTPENAQVHIKRNSDSPGRYGLIVDNKGDNGDQDAVRGVVEGNGTGERRAGIFLVTGSSTGLKFGVQGVIGTSGVAGEQYAIYGSVAPSDQVFQRAGYFSGDVTITGTLNQPSDGKLKKQVETAPYGLEAIKRLRPVRYEYQREKYDYMTLPKGAQLGFLAEELEEVLPELVQENRHPNSIQGDTENAPEAPNGTMDYKGINYIGIIPVLTRAMQEQQEEIEEVKADNEALYGENIRLKKRLDDLEEKLNALLEDKNQLPAGAYLQNFPNPFSHSTTIRYELPHGSERAKLVITNMAGQMIRSFDISGAAQGSIELSSGQLAAGGYNYSLIVDGEILETRTMIVNK